MDSALDVRLSKQDMKCGRVDADGLGDDPDCPSLVAHRGVRNFQAPELDSQNPSQNPINHMDLQYLTTAIDKMISVVVIMKANDVAV